VYKKQESIRDQYIKVALPVHCEEFPHCKFESVWVLVDQATKDACFDCPDGVFHGTLDNNSIFYPELVAGVDLAFRFKYQDLPQAIIE